MAIQHELAWSSSRQRTFADCRRRYYYDYYLSWRGWQRDAPEMRRRVYMLKKMTRLPMHAGTIVHDVILGWFRERAVGEAPTTETLIDRAVSRLRSDYATSRSGRWQERPSKLVHLAEHHYEEPVIDEASGAAATYGGKFRDRIARCLEVFADSDATARFREVPPERWLQIEQLDTFEVDGTKVYAAPDFAWRAEDGTIGIVDWKTGRPRATDLFQLGVYALFAMDRWSADPDAIRLYAAYLHEDEVQDATMSADDLEQIAQRIRASIAEMRELYFDADRSSGDPEDFPMIPADAPHAKACRECNYRELCDRV